MPFTINCRWVVKVVADIKTIKKIAIAFVAVSVEPRKVEERGAPKKLASLADIK